LDNLWSFDEVIGVEIILAYVVLTLSQFPNLATFNLSTERDINTLPEFWRDFSFLAFVISGIITPTIDGYTQLSFAFSGISLYLVILLNSMKRINQKFSGSISLNF
jgi:Sec-independent protein secretion pathway component TatC